MKKIIALVLAIVCLLLAVGCKEETSDLTKVQAAFENGMPTKILVETVTNFDGTKLYSEASLTMGSYQGRTATVYTHVYQTFDVVESILNSAIISKQESKEYFEGLGYRQNFISNTRAQFVAGNDFAPETVASFIPNFQDNLLTNATLENGLFKATIPQANAAAVFGEGMTLASDATVEIVIAGGNVITMTLNYEIPALMTDAPNGKVTMTTSYFYDVQLLQPLTNE